MPFIVQCNLSPAGWEQTVCSHLASSSPGRGLDPWQATSSADRRLTMSHWAQPGQQVGCERAGRRACAGISARITYERSCRRPGAPSSALLRPGAVDHCSGVRLSPMSAEGGSEPQASAWTSTLLPAGCAARSPGAPAPLSRPAARLLVPGPQTRGRGLCFRRRPAHNAHGSAQMGDHSPGSPTSQSPMKLHVLAAPALV